MDVEAFDDQKLEEYAAQAKTQWGDTEAYREYAQKSKGRTQAEDRSLAAGLMEIFTEFGKAKQLNPSSKEAQDLVRRLQGYITEHYYSCTKQILAGLGQAYAAGGAFTENIDKAGGPGTAAFASEAIQIYCTNGKKS